MSKRVLLITGGLGFIGSKLLIEIAVNYDKVYIVDSFNPFIHKYHLPSLSRNMQIISGKVEDSRTWDYVDQELQDDFASLDVVHLASETSTGLSLDHPSWHTDPNVNGTSLLIEFLDKRREKVRRIVLSSSRAVYGEGAWLIGESTVYPNTRERIDLDSGIWNPKVDNSFCENFLPSAANRTFPNPCNVYGATKLAQEQLIQIWARSRGVQSIVLRFQNVYGPGQALDNGYSGILAFFVKESLEGGQLKVYEGGEIIRDFVYVDDVVSSLVAALAVDTQESFIGDIGTGIQTSLFLAATVISEYLRTKSPLRVNQYRLGDVRSAACDPLLTQEFLGVSCTTTPEKGLGSLINWARDVIKL